MLSKFYNRRMRLILERLNRKSKILVDSEQDFYQLKKSPVEKASRLPKLLKTIRRPISFSLILDISMKSTSSNFKF